MQAPYYRNKTLISFIVIVALILVGAVFLFAATHSKHPAAPHGATQTAPLLIYPAYFPKELGFDLSPLDSIQETTLPNGQKEVTARYVSPNSPSTFLYLCKTVLTMNNWGFTVWTGDTASQPGVVSIAGTKEAQQVNVTMAPSGNGTAVTVQYQQ